MGNEELKTVKTLAKAWDVSIWTIYRMVKQGLPRIQVGSEYRFEPDEARKWLQAGGFDRNRHRRTRAKRNH